MRPFNRHFSSASTPKIFVALLLFANIQPTLSIPAIARRQTSLDSLRLPTCALTCFINSLTTDGCDNETDFQCHCKSGKVLSSAGPCLERGCSKDDRSTAIDKVKKACEASGGGQGDGDEQDGGQSRSSRTSISTADSASSTSAQGSSTQASESSTLLSSDSSASTSPSSPSQTPPSPSSNPAPAPPPTNTANPTETEPPSQPTETDAPESPTDIPLALLPTERQLSTAAKAGISVSVTIFACAILISIALYIRRLKRDLKAAQAAAGVPESVWRAHISTAAAPGPISRRKSWRSGLGLSPVTSPLSSPTGMSESGTGIAGVLKKKRGHVLSVVVEREEEDTASMERMVREPVPGQREGLVDPLELDSEETGRFELPTSITPRTRSRERSRERGSSFGESSRTSLERGRFM